MCRFSAEYPHEITLQELLHGWSGDGLGQYFRAQPHPGEVKHAENLLQLMLNAKGPDLNT